MGNRTFIVTIDANDADYQSDIVTITDKEFERFLPLIKAINEFKPYVSRWGANTHNFVIDQEDEGVKNVYEYYNQFDEELIEDFIDTFINFDLPYGMHSLINLQEITLGERFIDGEYKTLRKKADKDPIIKEYERKDKEFYNYTTKVGMPIHCTPYAQMTEEEVKMCKDHENLWKEIEQLANDILA